MRMTIAVVIVLLTSAIAWSVESSGKVYPLTPSNGTDKGPRGGYSRVSLDRNGLGEIPFPTASGKLRFKSVKNVVQVDLNDDGQFAEAETVRPGAAVSVPIQVAGKPYAYPFVVYGGGQIVTVMSMAWLEAKVDGQLLRILDGNCNGRFGDVWKGVEGQCDSIAVGTASPKPLGPCVAIGSSFYQLEVLDGGANLRLQPYAGATSTITATTQEGYFFYAQLRNKESGLTTEVKSGESSLVLPGTYAVTSLRLQTVPAKPPARVTEIGVMLYGKGGADQVIKEGPNALTFGLPLKLEFKALNTAQGVSVKEVQLVGAGGEAYTANNNASSGKCTLTTELRSGSEKVPGAKLSYG